MGLEPVLVAGATGFLGRAVLAQMGGAGISAVALSRSASPSPGTTPVRGDLRDRKALDACFAHRPGAVVNLVGLHAHVEGTEALVAAAQRHGVRRYIHVSALRARPQPRTSYMHRKWQAEERVRASGLDYTILRPSVLFGGDCDFLQSLLAAVRLAGVTPMIGSGRTRIQPLHVDELATVILRCLTLPAAVGRSYDLGGPEVIALDDIVTALERRLGRRKPRIHVPLWAGRLATSRLAKPLLGLALARLEARIHPERRLSRSHIELLAEDNVCAQPPAPEFSDLCRTRLSSWLRTSPDLAKACGTSDALPNFARQ